MDTSPLLNICFAGIISQSVACLFIFSTISFEKQKFLILMRFSLSMFKKKIVCPFCVLVKRLA